MAQCRPKAKIKEALKKHSNLKIKKDKSFDKATEESLEDSKESTLSHRRDPATKRLRTSHSISLDSLRLLSKSERAESPHVDNSRAPTTKHSNMKTKLAKDEADKSLEEDVVSEPKTRARKKASDTPDEDKNKPDEPKTSKDPKKTVTKPKAVVKKRPLGIRKTLRNKKVIITKDQIKKVIKQGAKRGRKPATKTVPSSAEKETVPLISADEIKKEPGEELAPTSNSRSSSPRTAGRRSRLGSDMIMMKSVLGDSPSSLVTGPRTSPYPMRSERSNSPSLTETKNLRSGKPRKVKNNLLNEVVMKEQKKRRRLMSESKTDSPELNEDAKKLKRGRSCSRDGSEISKCSDVTESDISLSETLSNDAESKELNKKLDKPKTDLDVDIENNLQNILTTAKVPFLNADSKTETKPEMESPSNLNVKNKKKMSLKRSTSIDSDNNNSSNRLMLETINNSLDIEDKASLLLSSDNDTDTLFNARSSILTSMSKTFNSKEVSKNIRKARRGRRTAAAPRAPPKPATSTITNDTLDDKHETLETLSKEIDDLISNLDQSLDDENNMEADPVPANAPADPMTKSVSKFYGLSKPLCDNNSNMSSPETPVKDKEAVVTTESTPSKVDDSENMRLHYEEDSTDRTIESNKQEVGFKCSTVASIDKLMDRLKEFEEFDKKRQRQESESKSIDSKQVMVTNDVVLIPKSGADIKPLKDLQSVRSPEKPFEKENVLSCFENNSAISILKRDHARKSIDIDLPNSVTLIKRNSISRKESTGSNHSRESTDAISIFEKSLGKDVTLTEIRKSGDKAQLNTQIDLHQFATLHPNNPSQNLTGHNLDSKQISITPRVVEPKPNDVTKRAAKDHNARKSSEAAVDPEVEKMATIEKIKSAVSSNKSLPILQPVPVAIKSPEVQPMDTEPLAPPLENVKPVPEVITTATEVPKMETDTASSITPTEEEPVTPMKMLVDEKPAAPEKIQAKPVTSEKIPEKTEMPEIIQEKPARPEKIQEKPTRLEKIQGKPAMPEKTQEKPATPKKIQEKPAAPEKIQEKPATLEKIQEKPPTLEKIQEKPATPEKIQEKLATLEKIQEKPATLEKIQEKPATLEKIQEKRATSEKTEVDPEIKAEEPKEEVKEEAEKDSKISESAETAKPGKSPEKLSKVTRKSVESLPGPSNLLFETPESQKRKENVLRTLGLLTHKAANEAKIEKAKEKERLYYGVLNKNKAPKSGDYTGTLKTVIKLNRSTGERDRKKYRSSLKITFQKSKNRSGKPSLEQGQAADEDDAYYTIERREAAAISDGVHRKSYSNRLNSHDPEAMPEVAEPTKEPTLNLVIPEKASSFSIHPGRLCMDQCFYCGGKFGLFDTPCHIAQMKSAERQKKVLDNEEKLTIDSCLCDACYRHVDRRANCPSYRKRPPLKHVSVPTGVPAPAQQQTDKPPSPTEEESEEESRALGAAACHTFGCGAAADRAIRRKWLIKMRASVNKVLKLEGDYPGLHTIPLCAAHYRLLAPLLQCALCRRRLTKHHNVHTLHHGFLELNPLLRARNIPVQFSERPVLCKQCRYYCLVLQRPNRTTQADANNYRRRLLQIHNVDIPPESENETEDTSLHEDGSSAQKKKKSKVKNKQRKSTSPVQPDQIQPRVDRTSESSQGSEKNQEDNQDAHKQTQPLEEDIESLISSNKIMVPGAKGMEQTVTQSDGSEPESQMEYDGPALPLDKQTELQYLLQKQNNPAQFMKPGANLTQKQRNILKLQTITSGIQKPGQLHRVHEKNAKRIHKLGQIVGQNDKGEKEQTDFDMLDPTRAQDTQLLKNLNEECTIESIPNKKPADISILKNKWEMSGSSTQVKKNLSELSKKLTIEKAPSKKLSDLKYSNPVKRLETNPSISVRELFPGEEELPLQCNIEFNSVKGVTPEGWEKCNSTVQYDIETKRLWTELQRPYGNQSSFLRHLVLLEKYFRSGDLVLSQNASPHAATYSDSVQSRLRAYDNVVTDAPRRSEPSISLIEFRKQKPTVNGKSLLKTNQSTEHKKPFMPPPGALPKPKKDAKKSKQLPPELIAINTPNAQGRKAIQNVLHNIQQLVKGVSAADPTEVAAAPLVPPPLPAAKFEAPPPANPPKEKKEPPSKSDAPKKQRTTSKPWRPTLMPITPENLAKIAREPPQTAVDGRTLPSLVQVMSSGKRYHITLQDYNKMCIMRREKLQQLQDGEPKAKRPSTETTELITEIHPNVILGNGGTMTQNVVTEKADKPKDVSDMNQMGNAATILKNVGLKNITIAPIPAKTATVTSHTLPVPMISSPSLMVTSTPIKIPNLGPSLSITSETVLTPTQHIPIATTSMSMTPIMMSMPKIPKSLTVIPQTVIPSFPQGITTTVTNVMPSAAMIHPPGDGPRP